MSDEIQIVVSGISGVAFETFVFDNTTPVQDRHCRFYNAYDQVTVNASLKGDITSGGPYDVSFLYTITALND